jgi:hypothetical protein
MNITRLLRVASVAVLLASAAACNSTSYEIKSTADVGVDFKYRTFSFGTDPAKLPKDFTPTSISPEVKKKAEETINLELGKLGYAVDDATPELEVLVASGQRPNRFRSGKLYDSQIMNDGSLVVEVWDVRAGDLIWHGVIDAHIDPNVTPDLDRIGAAVARMMQSFPPAART